jgi:hypothetical protein
MLERSVFMTNIPITVRSVEGQESVLMKKFVVFVRTVKGQQYANIII